jgi:hypothetical protein
MKTYQSDHDGFYVGEVDADESPLEPGVFLIPGGAVEEIPPPTVQNEAARLIGGKWEKVPDYQGVEYYDANGKKQRMDKRGEPLPPGSTMEEPADVKAAREAEAARQATLAELNRIDMDSIRSLREYVASQADAPQYIKDHEATAQLERGKL